MKPWRFLAPNMLGFTWRTVSQAVVDKIKGAPSRPVQVAAYVAEHAERGNPEDVLATIDRFNVALPYHIIALPPVVTERYSSNVDMFWRPQDTDDPAHAWLREHVRSLGAQIHTTEVKL